MFSMKKEREEEKNTHKKKSYLTNRHPPSSRPLRSNPAAWKLLGPAYMSHVAEKFCIANQALSQMFLYCLPYISKSKRNVTV